MKKTASIFFLSAIFILIANTAIAGFITTIPQHIKDIGAENNELLKLGFLDVTLYGADPTGQKDSTSAIQQAVNDARKHQLVTFFPHQKNGQRGVYLVSDTIDCRMRSYSSYDYGHKSNILIGSKKWNMRPLIRLKSNTYKFSDPSNPQPVFWFWSQAGHWEPKQYQRTNNPWDNDQDISFNQMIRGIDIDLGANPGAIGIKNPGAQGQAIENVTIYAKGAFAGLGNLAGLGAAEYDITVIGGRYGIYIDTMKRTLSPYNGKVSIIGSKFIDQEEAVIRIVGRQASPVLFAGFLIENKKSIPFNIGKINSNRGGFVLISGIVDVPVSSFIERNDMGLYLRDVYFRGVSTIADNFKISDNNNWTLVTEFSVCGKNFTNLVDGEISNSIVAQKTEGLKNSKTDLVARLVTPHKWNEWTFPSFEDDDVVNVKTLGVKGDGFNDDTIAIQQAIDKHEKIFFPKGIYLINNTITLRANTKIIGSSKISSIILPHPNWKPTSEAIMIATDNSSTGTAILSDFLIANHATDKFENNKIDIYNDPKLPYVQVDQYNFTPIEWKVGRNSILRDVIGGTAGGWLPKNEQRNNYHRFRVNGSGGGRWFSVLGAWRGHNKKSRGMLIENTSEPMYIYPVNFANDPKNITIEVINSKNKFFFFPAFEGGKSIFKITNCNNIAIFSSYKNDILNLDSYRAIVEIYNSSDILAAMITARFNNDYHINHLREDSSPLISIIFDKNIGLYKRGSIRFTHIATNTDIIKPPKTILRIK